MFCRSIYQTMQTRTTVWEATIHNAIKTGMHMGKYLFDVRHFVDFERTRSVCNLFCFFFLLCCALSHLLLLSGLLFLCGICSQSEIVDYFVLLSLTVYAMPTNGAMWPVVVVVCVERQSEIC